MLGLVRQDPGSFITVSLGVWCLVHEPAQQPQLEVRLEEVREKEVREEELRLEEVRKEEVRAEEVSWRR